MVYSPLLLLPGAGLGQLEIRPMLRSFERLIPCRVREAPRDIAESPEAMAMWLAESPASSAILLRPVGGLVRYGQRLEEELAGNCKTMRRVFLAAGHVDATKNTGELWGNVETAMRAAAVGEGYGVHVAAEGAIRPVGELLDLVPNPERSPALTKTQIADPLRTVGAEGEHSDVRLKKDRHGRWRIGDVVYEGGIKAKAEIDHSPAGFRFVESPLRKPPQSLGRS